MQTALQTQRPSLLRGGQRSSARRSLLARAEGPKVVREYREDDGKMVVPKKDGALYVDGEAGPRAVKPQDNMSKEMKARLRKEYIGFGGAENKAALRMPGGGRTRVVVAAATTSLLDDPQTDVESGSSSPEPRLEPVVAAAFAAAPAASEQPASSSGKQGASKFVVDPSEQLTSSWEHRAWTWGPMGLMSAILGVAGSQVASAGDAASVAAALAASYVLSDLGTGIYHWGVDNYGDGNTPLVGRQIAAFQGHHQRPWTITQREFCNNVHQVFKPVAYPAAALLLVSPLLPPAANAFTGSFLWLICMSQQFHAWSHMKKSELPGAVLALQEAGVLISRKAHGAHHKPNFDGNYCIVSGLWNQALDGSGFFRGLEHVVKALTGVEPRCWYPPEHDWAEQTQPQQASP